MEASTDHGTVLASDDYAACWSPSDGKYHLYMPALDGEAVLPEFALALLGAFLRLDSDPDFREECANWVRAQRQ